ncbi:hypothetical protein VSU19_14860 [Verrucomicrobiales bacterium BCK34]|nr:hypothetical protein [Verrucomicrobiales bacterium BCK34]
MKLFLITASLSTLLCSASSLQGQIRDDKDSYSLLAVQCLISAKKAGRTDVTLSDYDQYATSLAKTISFLSAEAQSRVFDPLTGSAQAASSPADSASTASSSSGASGMLSDMGDAIVGAVGDLNDMLSGEGDVADPIVGDSGGSGDSSGTGTSGSADGGDTLGSDTSGSADGGDTLGSDTSGSADGGDTLGSDTSGSSDGGVGSGSDTSGSTEGVGSDSGTPASPEEEAAIIAGALDAGLSEADIAELASSGGFDFWAFLMGLIEDVAEFMAGNSGTEYEEYDSDDSGGLVGGLFGGRGGR